MTKTSYRHNVMNINSINTFMNIKGGLNNGVRDVYFVRALGESADLAKSIEETDKRMDIQMAKMRLIYKRINSLPQIRNVEDSDFYSKQYLSFNEQNKGSLRQIKAGAEFETVISAALSSCVSVYKESRTDLTLSMEKNFGTKLLFWLDYAIGDCLNAWSEKACIKIIADNVIKEQEYLFYLFLTYLGCDVILIENKRDISLDQKLMKYSSEFRLGAFGNTTLTQYKRYVPKKEEIPRKSSSQQEHNQRITINSKVVIPERAGRRRTQSSSNNRVENTNNRVVQNNPIIQRSIENHVEKSFEELAQLASSVVLIAVHDSNGDTIGTGSGIMIGKKGFILTNNHVAAGGLFYSVKIEGDDEVYHTHEVIKYNSTTDLAVLRIQRELNPIPIYKGKKELVRGQKVVAIGSPLGLFNSVSDGIISGFRNINDVDMIQFTAPISHGSSGGAVLNMQGEIIGISTAGIDSGQNINLAIGYENIKLFTNGFIN